MVKVIRFQALEVWQDIIELSDTLLDIVDEVFDRKLYRFAEQLCVYLDPFKIVPCAFCPYHGE